MKGRPIIFNDEMVRAILDGRKTQTRRVIKNQPTNSGLDWRTACGGAFAAWQDDGLMLDEWSEDGGPCQRICPYGKPGDRLWVRETFGMEIRNAGGTPHERIVYRASKPDAVHCYDCNGAELPMKWKPSIHMPRWASRITLEITNVRVEMVRDISADDIRSEGIAQRFPSVNDEFTPQILIGQFMDLWQSIYGPNSWAANPWVWVIEFRRVE